MVENARLLIMVPARGGSKGLARKNCRTLADIPLLAWTADAIAAAELEAVRCVLSTDDEEIAAIGQSVGLPTPFLRPNHLAVDEADLVAVTLHAVQQLEQAGEPPIERIMLLQPTSPFRPPNSLQDAIALMDNDASIQAVVGVKPIYRSLRTLFQLSDGQQLNALSNEDGSPTNRQALDPIYTPNGAMYLVRREALHAHRSFFPPGSAALPMDQVASHDIDDATDWEVAEALARAGLTWRTAHRAQPR